MLRTRPGEPDFPTPDHIKKAGIKAIEENKSKYTPAGGIMTLREAIGAWHKRELGSAYDPKECVVSVGGKHSIFKCDERARAAGDEVIIPAPYWVSFPDIVEVCTRNAGVRRNASGRWLQRESRGHRESHHAKNKNF